LPIVIESHEDEAMTEDTAPEGLIEVVGRYLVDFLPPKKPDYINEVGFGRALRGLVSEQTKNMQVRNEPIEARLGTIDLIGSRRPSARRREFWVRNSFRVSHEWSDDSDLVIISRFMHKALGLDPRQFEGPWNIIDVRYESPTVAIPADVTSDHPEQTHA
jgi:hypothetical protein